MLLDIFDPKAAPRAIGIVQDNFRYHVLGPRPRAISLTLSLPAQLIRDGVDFLHSTFTPPPISVRPEMLTMHCLSSFVHPEFYTPLDPDQSQTMVSVRCDVCPSIPALRRSARRSMRMAGARWRR